MKRSAGSSVFVWLLRLVLVGVVLVVAFVPPLQELTADSTTDTATIADYHADMVLSADGRLRIVETIQVRMPAGKHGIFRIFDTEDERRNGLEHPVDDVAVTRDGAPETAAWVDSFGGTRTLKIGNAGVTLDPGVHTYVITSTTTDVLNRAAGDRAQFWWNIIGSWQMPMEAATVVVHLPAAPERSECVQGTATRCEVSVEEGTMTYRAAGTLAPHTPVTVRLTFPKGAVPTPDADPTSTRTIALSVLAGLVGAALGAWFIVATRERRPGFPVLFEPPQGVGPALGARVLYETDADDDLQATLYDLGERGLLRLDGNDDAWRINLLADPSSQALSTAESGVLAAFGLQAPGDAFLVSATPTAGQQVNTARSTLRSSVHVEAHRYLATSPAGVWGKVLGGLAVVGVLVIGGFHLFGDSNHVPWPLLIGLAAFAFVDLGVLLDPATGSKHTEEGREMWSRVGGFSRFLTTDSAESRFDAAAHMDWYPRYLAWALVLGSADAWARRFQAQGVELPAVPWIYWTGTGHALSASSFAGSFDAAITSASASYAASQASSGGGGGFSGGSGGGGGGGGSW